MLWAYQTTPRKGTKESPFCLCFEVEDLILAEIGSPSRQGVQFNAIEDDRLMREDLLFCDSVRNAEA